MKFKIGDRVRRLPGYNTHAWSAVVRAGYGNDTFIVRNIDLVGNLFLGNDKIVLENPYNRDYFEKVKKSFTL